jgi:SAM-dependent methyltransferase
VTHPAATSDYFANHARALRWPWSIYHRPLERSLQRFVQDVAERRSRARVLVIGCGLMQELRELPSSLALTVVDIDARAIDAVKSLSDPRVTEALVVPADGGLGFLGRRFDAIYAKEVIEHVVEFAAYLVSLRAILDEGGRLWLSTPNYGEPWLPVLERTVLELVARRSNFSRRDIHPTRFGRRTLARALAAAGFSDVDVRPTYHRLALVATAARG